MTTLYLRTPARSESEGALLPYAMLGDGGAIMQQGEAALNGLADLVAASRRVVLLLAAPDVTLLQVKVPPLPPARLRAALPGLVEEQLLSDPADCAIAAAPAMDSDGVRTVAVVQRAWFEALVHALFTLGARSVSALPQQLCLPLAPGGASAAIGPGELALRTGLYEGVGLALADAPVMALETARTLAGDAALTVYAASGLAEELARAAAGMAPPVHVEAQTWAQWIAGSKSITLDLVPALGSAGLPRRDWQRWRWPVRIALAALVVNIAALNVQWLRMKREADAVRQSINQTFKAAYPNQPVVDPIAQLRRNIADARASSGQMSPDEFIYQAAAFGDAVRALSRKPQLNGIEFRDGSLMVKVKPESVDRAVVEQLKLALSGRGLTLADSGAVWQLRSAGGVK
ncbi:MAG: type II secretion system protein GspL [Telluria sp.]